MTKDETKDNIPSSNKKEAPGRPPNDQRPSRSRVQSESKINTKTKSPADSKHASSLSPRLSNKNLKLKLRPGMSPNSSKSQTPSPLSTQKTILDSSVDTSKCPKALLDNTPDVLKNKTISRTSIDTSKCPCNTSIDAWKIDCSKCGQYWHVDCLSMKGITESSINKMQDYLCPFCYVAPISTLSVDTSFCIECRNTQTLRKLNRDYETSVLAEKSGSLKALNETLSSINLDLLNEGLSTMNGYSNGFQGIEADIAHMKDDLGDLKDRTPHQPDKICQLEDLCQTIIDSIDKLTNDTLEIHNRLDKMKTSTPEPFSPPDSPPVNTPVTPDCSIPESLKPDPCTTTPDYISQQEHADILSFLQSVNTEFTCEGNRRVLSYGEDYRYGKTTQHPTAGPDFPPLIQSLVDRINKEHAPNHEVNQCLINMYTGRTHLPEHSDDEPSIDPESSIYTVTVGASATVLFRDKHTSHPAYLDCHERSLYSMSRKSQEFFTHKIEEYDLGEKVRYSLTFRRMHWRYKNSLCIIADSNNKYLKFGEGENTFGFATPGSKIWAPHIKDINPSSCCAYRNVMLLCGINSLCQRNVGLQDVNNLYYDFKGKVELIRRLNPNCNLYICPILPTKLEVYNIKANAFNRLIFSDLVQSGCGIIPVLGFADLIDRTGFLSDRFSFTGDPVHLNQAGAKILARLLKRAMYLNKVNRGFHSSKTYAMAAKEGASGGVT